MRMIKFTNYSSSLVSHITLMSVVQICAEKWGMPWQGGGG